MPLPLPAPPKARRSPRRDLPCGSRHRLASPAADVTRNSSQPTPRPSATRRDIRRTMPPRPHRLDGRRNMRDRGVSAGNRRFECECECVRRGDGMSPHADSRLRPSAHAWPPLVAGQGDQRAGPEPRHLWPTITNGSCPAADKGNTVPAAPWVSRRTLPGARARVRPRRASSSDSRANRPVPACRWHGRSAPRRCAGRYGRIPASTDPRWP